MPGKLQRYLDALEKNREHDEDFSGRHYLLEDLERLERRVSTLESAIPLYRLGGTREKSGVARKLAELRNTISRVIYSHEKNEGRAFQGQLSRFMAESEGFPPLSDARIFVDMTCTLGEPYVTGIQRVVREFARRTGRHGGIPVCLSERGAIAFDSRKKRFCKVAFKAGDILVMPDTSTKYVSAVTTAMNAVRSAGGRNVTLIHDLIPFIFPQTVGAEIRDKFERWFNRCALASDGLICVSRAVADEVADYLEAGLPRAALRPWIDWSHLGCDFKRADGEPSSVVQVVTTVKTPFFLSVSTIEPRKGHSLALDAMEQLWAAGADARLVIVGRYGWGQDDLKRRIVSHSEVDRRLFWFYDIGDADLAHLYRHARAFIFASIAEGFGLPLLEAAHFGLPSIVSDIAVFREIAGEGAAYFPVADSDGLRERLQEALTSQKRAPAIPMMSWDAAAEQFFGKVKRQGARATGTQ